MKKIKEYGTETIFMVAIIILMILAVIVANYENKQGEKNYNNGICTECGGNYYFIDMEHIRNGGDEYYYSCDKCGHTITTTHLMK